jgi:hypothetical protein
MSTEEQSGIDEGLSRRGQFATGASAWVGGLVLALIAGWHLQSPGPAEARAAVDSYAAESPSTACAAAPDESTPSESADSFESPATFYPEDTIVAVRPTDGVTEMQGQ